MISIAYESFVNEVCAEDNYSIANENAITDSAKKIWDTIKELWKKFVTWVTSMVQKIVSFFKKEPKEASAEEIKKANVSSLPEKADSREEIRKNREEMVKRNKAKDDAAAKKDADEKSFLYEYKAYDKWNDEMTKDYDKQKKEWDKQQKEWDKQQKEWDEKEKVRKEKEEEQKRIDDEWNKKVEEKNKKRIHDWDNKVVKYVIISRDNFYWIINGVKYANFIDDPLDEIVSDATRRKRGCTIDDLEKDINILEKRLSKYDPNDIHTLEYDYNHETNNTATDKSRTVGYLNYECYSINSKNTVRRITSYINRVNKQIQNISEIQNIEVANKILELSRKVIPFYQQLLNNINYAVQSVRVVNIRRKEANCKSFL